MSDIVRFDRPPETSADDQPDWAAKLRASDRSDKLVKAILAAVTMLQARASKLTSAVVVPADGVPLSIAEHVTQQTRDALGAFEDDAAALAEKRLPRVVDLYGDYVVEKTGVSAVDTDAAAQQLIATVKDALGDTVAEVRKAVEDAVTGWFHNGGQVEDLRRIVREQLADAEWQAARVMRTEIQEAYKDLSRRALREGPATRVYRQAQAAACDFCVAKDGEYDIDDPEAYDTHPNCFPAGTVVSGARAVGSTDRLYAGDLVEILTASGHVLAVTPNHPVLTPQGWVPAGLLHEGDDVLSRSGGERPLAAVDPEEYQVPASIEDVAVAVGGAGRVSPSRVPVASEDFHGDGFGSEVAVVRADGLLRSALDTALAQPDLQQLLGRRDAEAALLPRSGSLLQALDRIATTPPSGLRRSGALSPLLSGRLCSRHAMRFADAARRHAAVNQATTDDITRYPIPERNALLRFAGDVAADQIVNVKRYPYIGHVYNLQTLTGWYTANSIIVHNCQCVWYALDSEGREVGDAGVAEMSKLSKAERDKLPASAFALPSKRLYPILDQDDVDSAVSLVGKHPEAKSGIIRRAKALKLTLPKAWGTADHAAFSLGPAAAFGTDTVRRTGKIWEAGDYPDKNFGMTPEEMYEAIAGFSPVDIDIEHIPSVFDGKLGKLVAVEAGDDGYSLLGTVEMPRWVDEVFPTEELPVSASWDIESRTLQKLALVVEPRVADAAVAAFAKRHDTPHGQMAMQEMHDVAARHGAVCKAPTADMASRHEASAIQSMHDTAVTHGATCSAVGKSGGAMPWFSKERAMSFKSTVQAWFNAGMPDEFEGDAETPAAPAAAAQPDPKLTALEAEVARLKAESITREAAVFADGEITAGRAVPAERDAMIAAFSQAAIDDASHGVVTFAAAGGTTTKSRTQLLRESYVARPASPLTRELLANTEQAEQLAAMFNQQKTALAGERKPMSDERKREMLAATATGRQVLESRN